MASSAEVSVGDTVLEIGPGKGTLTKILLESGARVIAIEKDRELIPILHEEFRHEIAQGTFTLIEADILELQIETVIPRGLPYKIVANIPYYITGAIIRLFLSSDQQPTTMSLMVQREVARRIVARNKKESLLSLSVKAYGTPRYIETVKRELFSPKPKVDSAIISIHSISKDFFDSCTELDFFTLIQAGFAHKRKVLIRNIEPLISREKAEVVFEKLCLNKKARAEDLELSDWKNILTG